MAFLNSNIPFFYCLLKKELLYNDESGHGEFIPVEVFAFSSITRREPCFSVMTELGSQHARVPLHYLVWREDYDPLPKDYLSIWDSFSYTHTVSVFEYLKHSRCDVILKDKSVVGGEYLFTIDWCNNPDFLPADHAERPDSHKCGHFIKLDNGNFALQPNNRIWWYDAGSFIDPRMRPEKIDWKIYETLHSVEQAGYKWVTEGYNIDYDYKKLDD